MRIPVFARGANPAIDPPNQRKSESYGEAEVEAGRADWLDPDDHSKGIVCRAFLYQGQPLKPAQPEQLTSITRLSHRNSLPPIEASNTQFDDPVKSLLKQQDRYDLRVRAEAYARFCDLDVCAQAQA
jgi:hypothetical protein